MLDIILTESQMDQLVNCLTDVGIMQSGVRQAWGKDKFLTVRLPWVKKGEDKSYAQQTFPDEYPASVTKRK